jgi:hypothetical protein
MSKTDNRVVAYFLILLTAIIPLLSLGLSNHGLWTADEPRVAEIGREMALSGNWAVPTLNQEPFLEEPPLYYGALAVTMRTLGVSDKVVRIPSALFAFGGIVGLFFLGIMLFGTRAGFLSAFIMATCGEYFRVAHWVIVDSALACFIILGMTFFMSAYLSDNKWRRVLFYGLCYVFCTLAFFVKGFVGVVIPGLAVLTFLILSRNLKEVLRMHLWLGICIFAAALLPWFLALYHQGGVEHLRTFLIHNHLERFAGGSTGHNQPFYYYLIQLPAGFLPWSLLIVPVMYEAFRKIGGLNDRERTGMLFAKCWFFSGLVFLSIASTKRVLYLMPIFAPISLLTAWYIETTLTRQKLKNLEMCFVRLFSSVPLLVGLAILPVYFYAAKKSFITFSLTDAISVGIFSLVTIFLSIGSLSVTRRDRKMCWILSSASVFSLLIFGLVIVIPLLDPYKSFVPFCHRIDVAVPQAQPLYGYQPDETAKGAVPFYTRRFLTVIGTTSDLEKIAAREQRVFIVIRDKKEELEKEILSTGKYSILFKQQMGAKRSLALLASRTPSVARPSLAGD